MYEIYPKQKYLDYALFWAEQNNWAPGSRPRHADDHCCGQTYIDLFNIEPDTTRIRQIKQRIDAMVNGWVFGAHVRTLQLLPESDPHYAEYLETYKTMAAALRKAQHADGFWGVSLADSNHYPGPETSGTGFFTYGLAWGINNGHLDSTDYYSTVAKAWHGLISTAVHPDGFLGYVQGVSILEFKVFGDNSMAIDTPVELNRIQQFHLANAYPNPFNASTTISYIIPKACHVKLIVHDIKGRKIRTLVDDWRNAGFFTTQFNATNLPSGFDASDLASGIYFYRLQAGDDFIKTKKMLLMR